MKIKNVDIYRRQLSMKISRTCTHKVHKYFYISLKSNDSSLMAKTATSF